MWQIQNINQMDVSKCIFSVKIRIVRSIVRVILQVLATFYGFYMGTFRKSGCGQNLWVWPYRGCPVVLMWEVWWAWPLRFLRNGRIPVYSPLTNFSNILKFSADANIFRRFLHFSSKFQEQRIIFIVNNLIYH